MREAHLALLRVGRGRSHAQRAPARSRADAPAQPAGWLARLLAGVRGLAAEFGADRCSRSAAAMTFFAAFSLAPVLVLLIIVGSVFVDPALLQRQIVGETGAFAGDQVASLISQVLLHARRPGQGWSALVALALLVFGATSALAELKDSLDQILAPRERARGGLRGIVRVRLKAFALILVLAVLLLASIAASALFAASGETIARLFGAEAVPLGGLVSTGITLAGTFLLSLCAYRLLPSRRLPWGALIYGALLATVLFALGGEAIVLYVGHSPAVRAFGTAGSLAVVLLWLYYSALAFFVGAVAAKRRARSRALRALVRG